MSDLTKKAIKAAFIKLLNEQPYTRISVRDIARECGINRNSFYYHYHDIPDMMEEIILDRTNALIASYPDISSIEECVQAAFSFIMENRKAISHIYHSVNREVFEQYLMKICEYSVTNWFDQAFKEKAMEESERQRLLRFVRFELFGAAIDWMNAGMPEDVIDEVKDVVKISVALLEELEKKREQA